MNHKSISASWAYAFVRVNGDTYGLSNDEINRNGVGKKLGVVKRNVGEMDHGSKEYVAQNFDSNVLDEGTPIFVDQKDPDGIVYEKKGHFFPAKKFKKP